MRVLVCLVVQSVWLLAASGVARAQCPLQLDAARWEEVLRDDFNGPVLDTALWDTRPRIFGGKLYGWGSEWYDTADTSLVRVQHGALHLRATRWRRPDGTPIDSLDPQNPGRQYPVLKYRAGMILLKTRHIPPGFGAYEARLKLPPNSAAWPTFWLWSCPTEIDIVDGVDYNEGGILTNVIDNRADGRRCPPLAQADPAPVVRPNLGRRIGRIPVGPRKKTGLEVLAGFNTFTMVWEPDVVRFFINGGLVQAVPRSKVGTVPEYACLMLNMQMYPWAGDDDAVLDVDYVRILKPRAPAGAARPYASTSPFDPACAARPRTLRGRLRGRR